MSYSSKDTDIALIKKNDKGDFIKVTKVESGGNDYLDIRTMYTNDAGEVMPTKKGVRFNMEMTTEILDAIFKAASDSDLYDISEVLQVEKDNRGIRE